MNIDTNTIDATNESNKMAGVALYARFLREWYTPLSPGVFTSTVVPDGLSQPRSKLIAAKLNTQTGEIVKRVFRTIIKKKLNWVIVKLHSTGYIIEKNQ